MRFSSALASFAVLAATSPAFAGEVWVTMDQVKPYTLEVPAGQIIVGNPGIADVKVQDKERILLFGKGPGRTNMYILDDEGNQIDNLLVSVRVQDGGMMTVQRGLARTTYNCTTVCEATVTVGDSPEVFSGVASQIIQKFGAAAAGATE